MGHESLQRRLTLEGLILHDWLVDLSKQRAGKPHTHWISAPLVSNDGELQPLLERLAKGDVDEIGSYVDRLVEERAATIKTGLGVQDT